MLNEEIWQAIGVTIRLAGMTTILLVLIGLPLSWWLARSRSLAADVVGAFTAVPLVLPPTVLGFYLLMFLGRSGPAGGLFDVLGMDPPAFTFEGLLIGSVIYSLPFMVQPVRNAMAMIGEGPLEAASTLRAGAWDRFVSVVLPLAGPGIVSGMVMSFAHTIGEFGVVLMIGGNIPGETRVISTLIYDLVELQDYAAANTLALGMVLFSLSVVVLTSFMERRLVRHAS